MYLLVLGVSGSAGQYQCGQYTENTNYTYSLLVCTVCIEYKQCFEYIRTTISMHFSGIFE